MKNLLKTKSGNHPVVKKAAKKAWSSFRKKVGRALSKDIVSGFVYSALSWCTSKFAQKFMERVKLR